MSKTVVLYNIDKLVSSTGTELAIDNAGASASLSRSESSEYIDYTFNMSEGAGAAANTHAADGHSSTATGVLSVGGESYSNQAQRTVQFINIIEDSQNQNYADLSTGIYTPSANSNGSTAMIMGGVGNGTNKENILMIGFAENSSAESHGTLPIGIWSAGGVSDGTRSVIMGGSVSGGYSNQVYMALFDDASGATQFGELTGTRAFQGTATDAQKILSMGGYFNSAWTDSVEVMPFEQNGSSTSFASLGENKAYQNAGSNGTLAIIKQGQGSTSSTYYVAFADGAVAQGQNALYGRMQAAGASNEDTYLSGGGNGGQYNQTEKQGYETSSVAVSGANLSGPLKLMGCASGTP